jgi:cation:H+ antiporter
MLIGLTIVAFGTSAPEFAVSVKSIISNNSDMVLGNVIGSNILNILLIIGICSLIKPIKVKSNTVRKELPIVMLFSTLLFFLIKDDLFVSNVNMVSRNDGFVILLFFAVFIYYLISIMRNKKDEDGESAKYGIGKSILFTLLGIVCIIMGSNVVVDSASNIATMMGISQKMIALTVVAFGTSLPELVTSIVSTRKGEQEILVGNIVGSNIFNIGIVLGLPVAMFGGIPAIGFNIVDLITMIVAAVLLFAFAYKDHKVGRYEGIFMLIVFVIYYTFVIIG